VHAREFRSRGVPFRLEAGSQLAVLLFVSRLLPAQRFFSGTGQPLTDLARGRDQHTQLSF
jgi:hypothetical protein